MKKIVTRRIISIVLCILMVAPLFVIEANASTSIRTTVVDSKDATSPKMDGKISLGEYKAGMTTNVSKSSINHFYCTNFAGDIMYDWDTDKIHSLNVDGIGNSKIYSLANDSGVYFAFDVADSSFGSNYARNYLQLYKGEHVTVTFRTDATKKGTDAMLANGENVRITICPFVNDYKARTSGKRTVNIASGATTNVLTNEVVDLTGMLNESVSWDSSGYVVEFFVSWDLLKSLGFKGPTSYQPGKKLYMTYEIEDNMGSNLKTGEVDWHIFICPINSEFTYIGPYDDGSKFEGMGNYSSYSANSGECMQFKGDDEGFKDVGENDYFAEAVEWAVENEITTGTSKNTFSPNEDCTREQIVTFLWRAAGCPQSKKKPQFTDVNSSMYSYSAIAWAVENGITDGETPTTFGPTHTATREQCVTFLYRLAKTEKLDKIKNPFKDVNEKEYCYDPIIWAMYFDITNGVEMDEFGVGQNCTRAQIITFIYRYSFVEDFTIPNNIFDTWDSSSLACFTNGHQTTASYTSEGIKLSYTGGTSSDPYITFSAKKYISLTKKDSISGSDAKYIVIKLKSVGGDGGFEVFTQSPRAGDSSRGMYTVDGQWHYVLVDMSDTTLAKQSTISTLRLDWSDTNTKENAYVIISEIGFFSTKNDAVKYYKLDDNDLADGKTLQSHISFPSSGNIDAYISEGSSTITSETDSKEGRVAVKSGLSNGITFVLSGNNAFNGTDNMLEAGRYFVVRMKGVNCGTTTITLNSVHTSSGTIKNINKSASYTPNGKYGGLLIDIRDVLGDEIGVTHVTFNVKTSNSNGKVYISSVYLTDDISEAVKACSHDEYALESTNYIVENPLASSTITADNEDPYLNLWFDETTVKNNIDYTRSTGITGYTVYMSKNEIEGCQFFLSGRKISQNVTISVDDFTNNSGDKLTHELFYEYYHNIEGDLVPDALPKLDGPITLTGGKSQGFYLKIYSDKNTPAGDYYSLIHVYDKNGEEIKTAKVCVHVWDITFTDETIMKTSFSVWESFITTSQSETFEVYYNWCLKNRINVMDVPGGADGEKTSTYLTDPRVGTVISRNFSLLSTLGSTPSWMDKVFYYPTEADEPRTNAHFQILREASTTIRKDNPNARICMPFERNLDLTSNGTITSFSSAQTDSIGYMSNYINVWCPIFDFFTTRDLAFVSGTQFRQSVEQDNKYGTFAERMKAEVAGGDELWAYKALYPNTVYTNWLITSNGTDPIVTLWQCKEYDVTGLLYWGMNIWKVNAWDQSNPWYISEYGSNYNSWGDGILFYSGSKFGYMDPVSSLRLENLREGIEDYQMLCMLEELVGKEEVDKIVSMVTTSVATYTTDSEVLQSARVLLGQKLEEALNK